VGNLVRAGDEAVLWRAQGYLGRFFGGGRHTNFVISQRAPVDAGRPPLNTTLNDQCHV
jgi:hypothetical protein